MDTILLILSFSLYFTGKVTRYFSTKNSYLGVSHIEKHLKRSEEISDLEGSKGKLSKRIAVVTKLCMSDDCPNDFSSNLWLSKFFSYLSSFVTIISFNCNSFKTSDGRNFTEKAICSDLSIDRPGLYCIGSKFLYRSLKDCL